jgi:hypothetical protein
MRRSPSTFFDRAEAAASNRPEAQIIVPDLFDDTTILPQRHAFCSPAIVLSFHKDGHSLFTPAASNRIAQSSLDDKLDRQIMTAGCLLQQLAQHTIANEMMEW